MASLSKLRDDLESDLTDQIAALQKEIAALRGTMKKQGSRAYDDASETIADFVDQLLNNTKGARKEIYSRARQVESTARENPLATAVVGAAAVGLIVALFASRR